MVCGYSFLRLEMIYGRSFFPEKEEEIRDDLRFFPIEKR